MQSTGHLVGFNCVLVIRRKHTHARLHTHSHSFCFVKLNYNPSHIVFQAPSAQTKLHIVCTHFSVCVCCVCSFQVSEYSMCVMNPVFRTVWLEEYITKGQAVRKTAKLTEPTALRNTKDPALPSQILCMCVWTPTGFNAGLLYWMSSNVCARQRKMACIFLFSITLTRTNYTHTHCIAAWFFYHPFLLLCVFTLTVSKSINMLHM